MAKWLRQRIANPPSWVRLPPTPLKPLQIAGAFFVVGLPKLTRSTGLLMRNQAIFLLGRPVAAGLWLDRLGRVGLVGLAFGRFVAPTIVLIDAPPYNWVLLGLASAIEAG